MTQSILQRVADTGPFPLFGPIETSVSRDGETYVAHHDGLIMASAFQPLFSVAQRRVVGHEALLRAHRTNGDLVSPLGVFGAVRSDAEAAHIDRLTRFLHVRNYLRLGRETEWLFLNVDMRSIASRENHSPFLGRLLRHFAINGNRLVIEILEAAVTDQARLAEAVAYFRSRGCLTAIDDFGSGHSNFDRLWSLSPEFVKLDRSLIEQSVWDRRVRNLLPHLVALLHEIGALVVMEGIETEDQGLIALDSGVDLMQGFLLGRPRPTATEGEPATLSALWDRFRAMSTPPRDPVAADAAFTAVIDRLKDGIPLSDACASFDRQAGILRAYLLDRDGRETVKPYIPASRAVCADPRYAPLAGASGTERFARPYFRRALEQPGRTQRTRPYFSVADATLCITLACAYEIGGATRVLCCDLASGDVLTAPRP